MNRFKDGPSPRQTQHDRLLTSITTLERMLAYKRRLLTTDAVDRVAKRANWSDEELAATNHLLTCECEALETAIGQMKAALSVPRLVLDKLAAATRGTSH